MIEQARYGEAIAKLKVLIPQFQEDLKAQAIQNIHSEPRSVLIYHLLRQSSSVMLNRRGASPADEDGFLYDQAVEIPPKVELETYTLAASVTSSILIFNLALALQLKSIAETEGSPSRERCFANAMTLYQLVLGLNSTSRMLSMIVLNNVALIHQQFQDHEKAQECFQRLLAIWVTSPVCPKDLEGMVYNAMGWYDTSSLPAPAA